MQVTKSWRTPTVLTKSPEDIQYFSVFEREIDRFRETDSKMEGVVLNALGKPMRPRT
jgi:hypothetical protein